MSTVIMPTSTDTSASFTHGNAPLADGETMTDNNPILAYHAMIDLPNTAQQNAAATNPAYVTRLMYYGFVTLRPISTPIVARPLSLCSMAKRSITTILAI